MSSILFVKRDASQVNLVVEDPNGPIDFVPSEISRTIIALWVPSFLLNASAAALISWKILKTRRTIEAALGREDTSSRKYNIVIAIVVESALLYSAAAVVYAIFRFTPVLFIYSLPFFHLLGEIQVKLHHS